MKIQIKHSDVVSGGLSVAPQAQYMLDGELAINYAAADPRLFVKLSDNTVGNIPFATHTNTYWHSGNDGASSTLDADLLDGQEGTYYLDFNNFTNVPNLVNSVNGQTGDVTINGTTNLSYTASTRELASSTGTNVVLPLATTSVSGLMHQSDKSKLDGIESGATADQSAGEILTAIKTVDGANSGLDSDLLDGQEGSYYVNFNNFTNVPTLVTSVNGQTGAVTVSGQTDLSYTTSTRVLASSTGTDVTLPLASTGIAGLLSAVLYTKLTGIEDNATADQTPAELLTAIRSVDGPSSGLDADLLDNQHGAYYLDYSNFSNTPTIPTNNNQLINGAGYTTFDGNYNSLTNLPTIPTNNNQLTNGAGYTTFDGDYNSLTNLPTIPTNNNQLTNGAGYITSFDITTQTDSKYLRSNASDTYSDGKLDIDSQSNQGHYLGFGLYYGNSAWRNTNSNAYGWAFRNAGVTGFEIRVARSASSVAGQTVTLNTYTFGTGVAPQITANGSKIWGANNDGAGSGLDADTLDGQQGSYYLDYNNLTNVPSSSSNANTLDNLDSSQFLRSDTSDTFSGGTLTVNGGSGLAVKAESADFAEQLEIHRNHATNSPAIKFSNDTGQVGILYADPGGNVLRWRDGTSSNNHLIWHAGNDGNGSGLDADNLDGKTWDSSGKNLRGTEIYADNWFRNYNSAEGLYNQATGAHWYSDGDGIWNLTGNTQNQSTMLKFRGTHAGNVEGWIYANGSGWFGNLNVAGQWQTKTYNLDGYSPNLYFDEEGNETWTGNPGSDEGKIEYHSNRFYIASGSNSSEVCRFRRSGTDVGYWANDGQIYATPSNHKVWHAGNDGNGSGLDADNLDGYGWGSSGKDVRGTEIYADNWFRNYNDGEGLYNQATGVHWHSDGDGYWCARDGGNVMGIRLKTNGTTLRGTVYANNSNQVGFLDSDGNWAVRVVRDSYVELRDNNNVNFRAGQGGVDGHYGTVSTHGGGKGNWEGYSINGRYVWMHDGSNAAGLYNDVDNEWHVYMVRNSYVRLYHNGSTCFETTGSGSATIGGSNVWHSGNDGAGSGLSADNIDGVDSSRIVYGGNHRKTNNSNPNSAVNSGFYDTYQTNAPTATWYSYLTMAHTNTGNQHGHQIAGSFYSDGDLFNRHYDGTTANFGNWTRIWNAANDGSGSGLDADTVDGIQGGSFLRSDESDSFSGTLNGSGSLAIARSSSYTPGAGNTNTGIVLRYTGVAYFSYGNGVTAVFNRNNNGDLVSWRRSGTEEGSIEINTSRVYYRTTSDYRRKNNVTPIANGIDVIKALKPSSYNWIEDNRLDHGFLAHEIQEHIPGSASGYKDEVDEEGEPVYQKVDLTTVVPFLTAALKDSIARIESLEATVAALQNA